MPCYNITPSLHIGNDLVQCAAGSFLCSFFLVITITLITLLTLPHAHASVSYSSPDISVKLLSQTPDPAQPGEIVEVRFKIENKGVQTTDDIAIEILDNYPFTVYSGNNPRTIGKLAGGQTGADAIIVDFKLRVDENAVTGDTELPIRLRIGKNIYQTFTKNEFTIDVAARDAILLIDDIRAEPAEIPAGSTANITLMLKNYASALVKNIRVTLDINNTPFAPISGSSYKRAPQIKADYQLPLTFSLRALPDADAGVYKIPIKIEYEDERAKNYSRIEIISLSIGSIPEIVAYIRQSTLLGAGRGTITIELANTGLTNIKFLQLTVIPSEKFEILSSSPTIYIGDIDSDDIETEDFEIYAKTNGLLAIPIKLTYRDANNAPYIQTIELALHLYTSFEQRRYGLTTSSAWPLIIVLILIVAGIAYWYKYRRQKTIRHRG